MKCLEPCWVKFCLSVKCEAIFYNLMAVVTNWGDPHYGQALFSFMALVGTFFFITCPELIFTDLGILLYPLCYLNLLKEPSPVLLPKWGSYSIFLSIMMLYSVYDIPTHNVFAQVQIIQRSLLYDCLNPMNPCDLLLISCCWAADHFWPSPMAELHSNTMPPEY